MKYLGPISDDKDLVNKEYVDNHAGGSDHIELTQAEYDALTPAQKTNGTVYFITDGEPDIPDITINDSVPIGAIQSYGGSSAPYGWVLCDGRAINRSAYSELFNVIGTTYGSGDGSTTFNVPDLRGRVLVGTSSSYALGATGGEATHTLTVNEMPSHLHGIYAGYGDGGTGTDSYRYQSWASSAQRWHEDGTRATNSKGGSQAHNNMQPYLVGNYIIKAKEPTLINITQSPVITDFIDIFYPVGSYYESSDASFDPNAAWGGTWVSESKKNDFIVEEGTSGIWTYRKWDSGIAECWGKWSGTLSHYASPWSGAYGYFTSVYSPTGLFSSQPKTVYNAQVGSGFTFAGANFENDNCYAVSVGVSGSTNVSFDVYRKGYWKTYSSPSSKTTWHRTA